MKRFFAPVLCLLFASTAPVLLAGVVSSINDVSLRTALAGGGNVTFSASGTILLTNTLSITSDTVIDGAGQTIAISGNSAFRVFQVSPGVNFTLKNVSIIHGRTNEGAGVFNNGGSVVVSNCLFAGNVALGLNGTNGVGTNAASSGTPGVGGACYSTGSLIVWGSTFLTNRAEGGSGGAISPTEFVGWPLSANGGAGTGGAIYAEGFVGLTNCIFTRNEARGGKGGASSNTEFANAGNGAEASGGAIYAGGNLAGSNTVFSLNLCLGGDAGNGETTDGFGRFGGIPGDASGGSIFCALSSLSLQGCSFEGNSVAAGYDNNIRSKRLRGMGRGGAICTITSTVTIAACRVDTNIVTGTPVLGGGLCQRGGTLAISNTVWFNNKALADKLCRLYEAKEYAPAWGGGLFSDASTVISDCFFATNQVQAGQRNSYLAQYLAPAGTAYGAGLCALGITHIERCTLAGNIASGGLSNNDPQNLPGGTAYGGGAYFATNAASLVNCTLAGNTAKGGDVTSTDFGYSGNAFGGGIYVYKSAASLTNCTLADNRAVTGLRSTNVPSDPRFPLEYAYGGNVALQTGTVQVINTILATGVSNNVFGTIIDLGYNLSSDASCAFSAIGSMNNTDAKLMALKNNGGVTPTIDMFQESPAIDGGVAIPGVGVDQRGVARPYSSAPDIGAYEWNATSFYTRFTPSIIRSNGHWVLPIFGPPTTSVRVQRSADLVTWSDISTNTSSATGKVLVEDAQPAPPSFYRTVSP